MPTTSSALTNMPVERLTEVKLTGKGVFDVLMQSVKLHLEQEYNQNRIRGTEYSQVYLGSMTAILEQSTRFLLDKDKSALEAALIDAQVRLAEAQILKSLADVDLVRAQIAKLERDDELVAQQILNMQAEALNIPKQGHLIDAQTALATKEVSLAEAKLANIPKEGAVLDAQGDKINREILTMDISDNLLTAQVLLAQAQKISTDAQSALVIQKTNTEKAQTLAAGVDVDSVVGKQKALYQSQIDGFKRDAEQKAARTMIDTWNARRTTDEGTVADATNRLDDSTIGKAVEKLLVGVGINL